MTPISGLFRRTYDGFKRPLVLWLLLIDLVLILLTGYLGLKSLRTPGYEMPDLLNIAKDASIAEMFNFVKWGLIIGTFFVAYRLRGHAVFFWLFIVFLFILADDSLQLHETVGRTFSRPFGEEREFYRALFEFGFLIALGVVCGVMILISWRNTPADVKATLWPLALLFAGLVFCGMGLDFLHALMPRQSALAGILLIAEDGGELIFISLMAAYALGAGLTSK